MSDSTSIEWTDATWPVDRHHLVMPDGRDRGTPWPGWGIDQPDAVVMERVGKKRAGRTWDEYPAVKR